jgi:RNase P protein component
VNRNKARRRMRALFTSYENQLLIGNGILEMAPQCQQ